MKREGARCILLVHAHPDDECISTGGTIARYSDAGVRVVLVTCTNGELGEIADVPELGEIDQIRPRLGEIRAAELREACAHLGDVDIRLLGYHDSGMDGTSGNDDPKAFVNQDVGGPIQRVVAIIRETRPDVLITYNEIGAYGHPDHIRAHEVAMAGAAEAASAAYMPELGPRHEIAKVYYTAFPKSLLLGGRDMAQQFGIDPDDFFSLDEIERVGTDDDAVTTRIDVAKHIDRKFRALEAHKTQRGTTEIFLQIPEEYRSVAMGAEYYVRVRPFGDDHESDLFEGLE